MRIRSLLAGALVLATVGPAGLTNTSAVGAPDKPTRPETVVSLTFDDGWKSQLPAADAMAARGMVGTFYISSSQVGYPAFLTVRELRLMQLEGHEIGGHTLTHPRLTKMSLSQARYQVCSDRAGLLALKLRVTSFAYPYGVYDAAVRKLPLKCGYNSARLGWGLYPGPDRCERVCPETENLQAYDRWLVRPVTASRFIGKGALPRLKRAVIAAEATGGWLPLLFHHVCAPDCKDPGIALGDFKAFIAWLEQRQPTTVVRSVDQVVSGSVRPAVGLPPFQIGGVSLVEDKIVPVTPQQRAKILAQERKKREARDLAADAQSNTAFTIPSFDVGQVDVIVLATGAALVGVLVYRMGSRRRRYEW